MFFMTQSPDLLGFLTSQREHFLGKKVVGSTPNLSIFRKKGEGSNPNMSIFLEKVVGSSPNVSIIWQKFKPRC